MIGYRRTFLSFPAICEMFEFSEVRASRISLGSCIQANTLRRFFFNIKPNWRDKTQLLANICASWSIRNNSPDRRGFALLISFSIVSKSRVISDTITTNWFITEFLLVNGKGDSSG